MSREIKFRGFHECDGPETVVVDGEVKRGRWVAGSLLGADARQGLAPAIVYNDYDGFYCEDEVLPATVGQFSGLLDRNGREIFEGDVLSIDGYSDAPVVFSQGAFQRHRSGGLAPLRFMLKDSMTVDGEVLGTVFDKEAT